jgi:spore coat polysaccharide biosynthesis protein SpsF
VFAEWIAADALRRATREAMDPCDREHVTRYFYNRPREFHLRWLPAPDGLNRCDLRLTVDVADDWNHACTIHAAIPQQQLDWRHILPLLDRRPDLRQRMADLNRANPKGPAAAA